MATYAPERLTFKALTYKDVAWIRKVAANYGVKQQHCRKLKVWRWEWALYKYAPDWQTKALDKQYWHDSLNDMVEWRETHR